MFTFIKKMIGLLSIVTASSHTKCLSLSNKVIKNTRFNTLNDISSNVCFKRNKRFKFKQLHE